MRKRFDFIFLIWFIIFPLSLNFVRSYEVTCLKNLIDEYTKKLVTYSSNQTEYMVNPIDWINLEANKYCIVYFNRTSKECSNGFLKFINPETLNRFYDFFNNKQYNKPDNMKIIKALKSMVQNVDKQSYAFILNVIRSKITEWDQLLNFIIKKTERFIKTHIFEVFIPFHLTENHKIYFPRFLDEIANEIDVIENKKDTLFSRNHLKRLLIPMLIILKMVKLKLLLLLPLIIGLVSFKKFLGFLVIVIPSFIGFLKAYTSIVQVYTPPIYLPTGVGFPSGQNKETHLFDQYYKFHQFEIPQYSDQSNNIKKFSFGQ